MRLWLVFLLASCTKVERTTLQAPPATIAGAYETSFGGVAAITPDALGFTGFPCEIGDPRIGGTYVYDPRTGWMGADLKSLTAPVRLVVDGYWTVQGFEGTFESQVSGSVCSRGGLTMTEIR